jgi:hypothetical protein
MDVRSDGYFLFNPERRSRDFAIRPVDGSSRVKDCYETNALPECVKDVAIEAVKVLHFLSEEGCAIRQRLHHRCDFLAEFLFRFGPLAARYEDGFVSHDCGSLACRTAHRGCTVKETNAGFEDLRVREQQPSGAWAEHREVALGLIQGLNPKSNCAVRDLLADDYRDFFV